MDGWLPDAGGIPGRRRGQRDPGRPLLLHPLLRPVDGRRLCRVRRSGSLPRRSSVGDHRPAHGHRHAVGEGDRPPPVRHGRGAPRARTRRAIGGRRAGPRVAGPCRPAAAGDRHRAHGAAAPGHHRQAVPQIRLGTGVIGRDGRRARMRDRIRGRLAGAGRLRRCGAARRRGRHRCGRAGSPIRRRRGLARLDRPCHRHRGPVRPRGQRSRR